MGTRYTSSFQSPYRANTMFEGFAHRIIEVGDAAIATWTGGSGPPLLLLHGYPQTHVAWHRLAPVLAREFTVVATDLRGYGDSRGPAGDAAHLAYSKRAMAADQAAVMRALGHTRFGVISHDRGARVGYRLALDHPSMVAAYVSLTVLPTGEVWRRVDKAFATGAYHWFLFAQPHDLPERLIGADPAFFLDWTLRKMAGGRIEMIAPDALAEYHRCFAKPQVRHAMIEDYRAAASVDDEIDRADQAAGRKLACPVQVLWEQDRYRSGETPIETWSRWADDVCGEPIASGHLMAEEAPDAVLEAFMPFLRRHLRRNDA